jgi:hypothetical protein
MRPHRSVLQAPWCSTQNPVHGQLVEHGQLQGVRESLQPLHELLGHALAPIHNVACHSVCHTAAECIYETWQVCVPEVVCHLQENPRSESYKVRKVPQQLLLQEEQNYGPAVRCWQVINPRGEGGVLSGAS